MCCGVPCVAGGSHLTSSRNTLNLVGRVYVSRIIRILLLVVKLRDMTNNWMTTKTMNKCEVRRGSKGSNLISVRFSPESWKSPATNKP
jgi:hypothetical protein